MGQLHKYYVTYTYTYRVYIYVRVRGHRPRSSHAWMTAQVASSSEFIVSYAISLLVFFANFFHDDNEDGEEEEEEMKEAKETKRLSLDFGMPGIRNGITTSDSQQQQQQQWRIEK